METREDVKLWLIEATQRLSKEDLIIKHNKIPKRGHARLVINIHLN